MNSHSTPSEASTLVCSSSDCVPAWCAHILSGFPKQSLHPLATSKAMLHHPRVSPIGALSVSYSCVALKSSAFQLNSGSKWSVVHLFLRVLHVPHSESPPRVPGAKLSSSRERRGSRGGCVPSTGSCGKPSCKDVSDVSVYPLSRCELGVQLQKAY